MGLYPGVRDDQLLAVGTKAAEGAPQVFIGMAETDPCVPPERVAALFLQLKKGGAPDSELHIWPHGKHGFGSCTLRPEVEVNKVLSGCEWVLAAKAFIRKQVERSETLASQAYMERLRKQYPQWVQDMEEGDEEPKKQ